LPEVNSRAAGSRDGCIYTVTGALKEIKRQAADALEKAIGRRGSDLELTMMSGCGCSLVGPGGKGLVEAGWGWFR
jgi:hypothetical protein